MCETLVIKQTTAIERVLFMFSSLKRRLLGIANEFFNNNIFITFLAGTCNSRRNRLPVDGPRLADKI